MLWLTPADRTCADRAFFVANPDTTTLVGAFSTGGAAGETGAGAPGFSTTGPGEGVAAPKLSPQLLEQL